MAKIKGVCRNIDECNKALNKEIQEVEKTSPFVCEECEKPLVQVEGKVGVANGGNKNKIIVFAAVIVVIGGGIGAYFGLSDQKSSDKNTSAAQGISEEQDKPKQVVVASISFDKASLDMLVGETDSLKATFTPAEAKTENLEWTSADTKIATVEKGIVKAIGKGETTITLSDRPGNATAVCRIKVAERPEQKVNETNSGLGASTGQISYGKWTGGSRNGKPHGTQVTFTFTSSHQIDSRDPKKRIANVGDYVIGEYEDGRLIQGRWYKKSGEFESVIIGR